MDLEFTYKGNWGKSINFLNTAKKLKAIAICNSVGKEGLTALEQATPKRTGKTAANWYYKLDETKDGYKITWCNANVKDGTNIALLLQYGHATRSGSYVEGIDYVNPALKPVFENIGTKALKQILGGVVQNVI